MTIGDLTRDFDDEVAEAIQERRFAQAGGGSEQRNTVGEEWGSRGRDAVMRIPVSVRIVLGATSMPLHKLLSLNRGSIIPLDRKVGDMVDIVVNDKVVARGEVVVLDEEASRFAVSVREVVVPQDG